MKIVIAINVNPRLFKASAISKLAEGTWKLELVGVVDSIFTANYSHLGKTFSVTAYHGLPIPGSSYLEVAVAKAGTEQSIGIYAKRD